MQARLTLAASMLAALLGSACGDDEADGTGGGGGSTSATPSGPGTSTTSGGPGSGSTAAGDGGSSTPAGTGGDGAGAPDTVSSSNGSGGGDGGGGAANGRGCAGSELGRPSTDCASDTVRCVGGDDSEYDTIQDAADVVQPGDVVVVASGTWTGFQIDASGTAEAPITFFGLIGATIDTPAETGDGIRIENASHVRVWGFTIEGVPERCIAARGATPEEPMVDVWVLGNTCTDSGVEGFYLSEIRASHVESNRIRDTGTSGSTRSHGIYLANAGSDDTTICGNSIAGAVNDESNGIHFNGDLSVGGDGVISGLVVESNVVYGNAQNGFNLDGVRDSTFRNNVVWGNGRHAMRAYAIDGAEGPADIVVVNNTFIAGDGSWSLRFTEDDGGHVVFDNILIGLDPEYGSIAIEDGVDIQSDHNIVVDGFSPDGEESIVSLADWQELGYDESSFIASPEELFLDFEAGDFRIPDDTAPSVDACVASFGGVDAPAGDNLGNPRPVGAAFDCGAYELQ